MPDPIQEQNRAPTDSGRPRRRRDLADNLLPPLMLIGISILVGVYAAEGWSRIWRKWGRPPELNTIMDRDRELRVGITSRPAFAVAAFGQEYHFFTGDSKSGTYKVDFRNEELNSDPAHQLVIGGDAGGVDLLAATLDDLPKITEEIPDVQIVSAVALCAECDAIVVANDIQTAEDLARDECYTLVPRYGPGHWFFENLLKGSSLNPEGISAICQRHLKVSVGSPRARQWFVNRKVPAAVLSGADIVQGLKRNHAHILVPSGTRVDVVDLLMARPSFLRNDGFTVTERFLRDWERLVQDKALPRKAAQFLALKGREPYRGLNEDDLTNLFLKVRWLSARDNVDIFLPQFQSYAKVAYQFWTGHNRHLDSARLNPAVDDRIIRKISGPPAPAQVGNCAYLPASTMAVYFDTGLVVPVSGSEATVDQATLPFRRELAGRGVCVAGFTDNTGAEQLNFDLSRGRAQWLAKQMEERWHVPKDAIQILPNGMQPGDTDQMRKENRKAMVYAAR